jgi:hypothetical protein
MYKNLFLLLGLSYYIVGCSAKSDSNSVFHKKRSPIQNEFLMHGGHKVKLSNNPFASSQDVLKVYDNKSGAIQQSSDNKNNTPERK